MKKKIIIVLLIASVISITSYFIYNAVNYKYDIDSNRIKINYCKKKDCGLDEYGYLELKSNFDIKKVNKKLDDFNKLQKNKIKELKNYKDFSSDKCKKGKDEYNYNAGYDYYSYIYVTDKYISLDLFETKFDLCGEYTITGNKIYKFVYDVVNDKFLSDSDILKKIGYTNDYVLNIIHLDEDAKNVSKYDLVIDETGDIYAMYINDNNEIDGKFINKKIDYVIR